jgi:hypothetical protein
MVGTSAVSAAPVSGITLGDTANSTGGVTEQVRWRGHGWRGGGWRGRGWRGRGWYGPYCPLRCNVYGRCWRVCW